jgi:formylglycine-generating enzyme required for sulfatase activity
MATIDHPFVNSLGMKFVPVEIHEGSAGGKRLLFSVWDTRVQDYAVFAKETGLRSPDTRFPQELTHPAVNVSWEDAQNYCVWLSKKEGRAYRLPTDAEWSAAIGAGKYPWGDTWPLPKGAGNYDAKLQVRKFPLTSPVGSFAPNACGLYDMGGNVWQWCQDEYKTSMNDSEALERFPPLRKEKAEDGSPYRVRRGGAWNESDPIILRSSFRDSGHQTGRSIYNGFRCVLVVSGN